MFRKGGENLTIGEALKRFRDENEIPQKEIAAILGVSQQQYSLYETGKREIKAVQIVKLCLHYKISADYLLGLPRGLRHPMR